MESHWIDNPSALTEALCLAVEANTKSINGVFVDFLSHIVLFRIFFCLIGFCVSIMVLDFLVLWVLFVCVFLVCVCLFCFCLFA